MIRTSSPRRQSAALQTASINATGHPSVPKQILKKKAISKSEYLLREEWAPETINEYQMVVDEPSVTPVPPPKPAPRVQQQQRLQRPQQQTSTVSNMHGQGRGPNRRTQSQARSSSMFEEWKARSLVSPDKANGEDKTMEIDGNSTVSLQGDHKPSHGATPSVPDITLKETNSAPTISSPKNNKPDLNAAPAVSEHTAKQASLTPVAPFHGPNRTGGGAASGDDKVRESTVVPTASSQPLRTEGSAAPVVEDNKVKEASVTPTASLQVPKPDDGAAPITRDDEGEKSHVAPTSASRTKHRRGSSAASGVTNKIKGTRAAPTSSSQAPKTDGGAAPVVKANKVDGTDAAPVPLSRIKHKRGGSAASITSSNKTKGAGTTSTASAQAGHKAEVNAPIIGDSKVERSGVASPQVNSKTEESPASVNAAGEHPDKAVDNQIEPKPTCDVQFHQQKPEELAGGSAEIHAPAPSSGVTASTAAANPSKTTRKRANKKGTMIDKQDDKSRPRERVPEYAYTAPSGTGFTLTELGNLRIGVKLGGPDKVYFLPCFIEDPWRGMEPSRAVQPAPEAREVRPAEAMRWLPASIW